MRPGLAVIAAVARNGVIGRAGALPWHLPADLRHFRALTTGHSVIMGRRTWQSLGRALPGRQNIVVSRRAGSEQGSTDASRDLTGAIVVASLDEALDAVTMPEPAFCIGGGELYREALRVADIAYLTEIDCDVEGDTTFPPLAPAEWEKVSRDADTSGAEAGLPYRFVTYRRRASKTHPLESTP